MQGQNYAYTKINIWELFCNDFLNKHLNNNDVLTVWTQIR